MRRHQTSWTAGGSVSPTGQGRRVPGGSATWTSQPSSSSRTDAWSRRSTKRSRSPWSRVWRPKNQVERPPARPPTTAPPTWRTRRRRLRVARGPRAKLFCYHTPSSPIGQSRSRAPNVEQQHAKFHAAPRSPVWAAQGVTVRGLSPITREGQRTMPALRRRSPQRRCS